MNHEELGLEIDKQKKKIKTANETIQLLEKLQIAESIKQKEQSVFSSELKKGDEIVTASGIIGTINKIEDQVVTLELDSKTFVKVVPSAISKEMTEQFNKAKTGK